MSEENNLDGIAGWLILIAIGMVVTPIRISWLLITTYSEIFSTGIWEALTTQGSDAYQPLWAPILIGEIIGNSGLILAWLYMAYKFFTKSRDFPKWFIGVTVFSLIFIVADAFAIKLVLPNEPVFDPATTREVIRSVIMAIVWIPYVLISKRTRATFTR
jgi:hypothetical protein